MQRFSYKMYRISVPATTANLGPGFDSFGLALNMYNHFTIGFSDHVIFENCDIKNCSDNLVYTSAMKVFEKYYKKKNFKQGLTIYFDTVIPLSRGLGSSATCIVAGVLGANLLLGQPYTMEELFQIAANIEGHPDNIAPAFFGGLNISTKQDDLVFHKKISVSPLYHFYALIPDFHLSTSKSRYALPQRIDFDDAVSNISNGALMILSLMDGDFELLKAISIDKLHEPYRKSLIPGFDEIKAHALNHGALGCFLSGAGPSLLAIAKDTHEIESKLPEFLNTLDHKWQFIPLEVDTNGAQWIQVGEK